MLFLRDRELEVLERAFRSGRAQLIVVYGRRRLGKTTLVREFIKGKKGLYLFTPRGSIVNILDNYSREVRSQLGSWVSFSSWFDFLDFLDATSRERFVVVMDEFQWLGESQASSISLIQDLWDRRLAKSRIVLILVGSAVGMIERLALKGDSPLFGRKTTELRLSPLPYFRARVLWEGLSEEKRIEAYGVFGGTPAYMVQYSKTRSLKWNILTNILMRGAPLSSEPEALLSQELRSPGVYMSILERIASGVRGLPLGKLRVAEGNVIPYIRTLEKMDIVERIVPAGLSRYGARNTLYTFRDEFFRFWFKYVHPNRWMIELGKEDEIMETIQKTLNQYLSYTFEKILLELVSLWSGRKLLGKRLPILSEVKPYWKGDVELDVCGLGENTLVAGEAKWSEKQISAKEIYNALNRAEEVAETFKKKETLLIIASRKGFTKNAEMVEDEKIVTLTLEKMAKAFNRLQTQERGR